MNKHKKNLIAQAKGFHRYGLTIEQLEVVNFGEHTLAGIALLTSPSRAQNNQKIFTIKEAYTLIAGLNAIQTEGVTRYGLSREQVSIPDFGERTLSLMRALISVEMAKNGQEALVD